MISASYSLLASAQMATVEFLLIYVAATFSLLVVVAVAEEVVVLPQLKLP
jgi:hypothetical protein